LSHASFEALESRLFLSLTVTPAFTATGTPQHLSPAMIEQAYALNTFSFDHNGQAVAPDGSGETIAIVDAFGDPNITADLQVFDANFGLSNNDSSGNFVLSIATPQGPVQTDSGWATEESLDVEWAHAIAPKAHILLVEAPQATVDSLAAATAWAASQPGVVAVSMSWGDSPEFAGESGFDPDFRTPAGHAGVTFVAASGDDGQPNYPSTSPDVLAVGGTTLNVDNNGNWLGESPWVDSGGGFSPYERTNKPDVAYDADPNTGFLVYDSIPSGGKVNWQIVGGTSAGSPQWAALIAIADQGRALRGLGSLDGATQTIPDLYNLPSSDFNQISGNGFTGLGSPVGESVISALVGGGVVAGQAAQLAFVQQPTQTTAGSTISPAITVAVEDSDGVVVASDNSTVTLSLASGSGRLLGTLTATAVNGIATFNNVSLDDGGTFSLRATDSSLSSATSNSFNIEPPRLAFVSQPKGSIAGFSLPTFQVAVEDTHGNVLTDSSASVTISVDSGPGDTLGTVTVSAVNGVATFSKVSLDTPGQYTLFASDGSDASTTSDSLNIAAPGWVDIANTNQIVGWAINPDDSAEAVNIEIQIDGGPTQIVTANTNRPDLKADVGSSSHGFVYATPVLSAGSHAVNVYALEDGGKQELLGTETVVSQNSLFDEHYYLAQNPDVAAAVASGVIASGYDHYIKYGQFEGRSPSPYWDEAYYLQMNPDVAAVVKLGIVGSGFIQFYLFGQYENRPGVLYFNTDYYLANNPDVAAAVKSRAVSSAFEHFVLYGQYEGRSPMLYFSESVYEAKNQDVESEISGEPYSSAFDQFVEQGQFEGLVASNFYNERTYLADNPDVAAAVAHGKFEDGFQHWLMFGQFEGRKAV
jgi:hypothetical protein